MTLTLVRPGATVDVEEPNAHGSAIVSTVVHADGLVQGPRGTHAFVQLEHLIGLGVHLTLKNGDAFVNGDSRRDAVVQLHSPHAVRVLIAALTRLQSEPATKEALATIDAG